jgi:predicted LPLAT superfamily acyltransferase
MKSSGQHWAGINEISFVAGMRFLFFIYRVLGPWPFRLILYPVLFWYVISKPVPRHASLDYLRRVNVLTGVRTGLLGVMKHFAAFSETILDKMLLWGGLFDSATVRFNGTELMNKLIEEKRGAILVCSHLGNLELSRVLSRDRQAMRMTVLVHTKHAKAFNQMLAALDSDSQLNLMQVTEITPATAILLSEKIAQGELIVIAGDRVPVANAPRVSVVNFLNAPAAFPVGPYLLANVLQCPIYMLFSYRQARYSEIHFELLSETVKMPRKEREPALAALAAQYASRLEFHCLRAPLEWFNFYDFWHIPQLEASDAPG